MSKSKKIKNGVALIVVIALGWYVLTVYNSLIAKEESVKTAWGQVENQYQRRANLIPNLVTTVKGHAEYEKEALQKIIEARSKALQTTINPENINSETLQKFQQVQENLSLALSKLMVVIERYPDLKANQSFLTLQTQLEGTENRIAYERRRFNKAVKKYNTYYRSFPKNKIAKMFGFTAKMYFNASANSEKAVKVQL